MFSKEPKKELSLEEKVDQILRFQKQMRAWAIAKAVSSFLIFFIFVILPILATVYLWDTLSAQLGAMVENYQKAVDSLQTVGNATESVSNIDLENIMQKIGLGQ